MRDSYFNFISDEGELIYSNYFGGIFSAYYKAKELAVKNKITIYIADEDNHILGEVVVNE